MKILIAHNHYQQPGGEDVVFENEARLLASAGHQIETLIISNDQIKSMLDKIQVTFRTVENPMGTTAVRAAVESFRPDLIHVHNFFPLLSPAIYQVCRDSGIAVVQTLHNFRPICSGGQLLRNGKVCLACVKRSSIWGVLHRCYRGSFVASAAAARMITVHNRRGTWFNEVDRYIALTNFARTVFIRGGFPSTRIEVKPNFIADPGLPAPGLDRSGALFVGRLSQEKGVSPLIQAARQFGFKLRIAGTGPEADSLRKLASPNVTFLGPISKESVIDEIRRASVVVLPSIWYEGFPMVLIEAFACATPVVASNIGALAEIVESGRTGFLATPGDPVELGVHVMRILADPDISESLGQAARRTFLEKYTPDVNLRRLEKIYNDAISQN
jgi:glycosyltransferase involved in cell wall biosynthesis